MSKTNNSEKSCCSNGQTDAQSSGCCGSGSAKGNRAAMIRNIVIYGIIFLGIAIAVSSMIISKL
ncbi:MAG: hypothetical protein JXJ04_10160 [Spirochaetales bacterium]|nr:hypothetical protein [Spirochaetales bacterium]